MENKQKIPQVRFKGFTDAWEQRKVGELCSISTGKSNTQDKIDDGIYPFYVRSPIIEKSNKYLYDEEAVITVGDGVGTGKVFHYVNGKYDLHQRCYRMYDFSDELDAKYFYHIFSHLFYKRVMAMTAKTSVDSVRLEMISDMKIPTPCIKEQRVIGQCLTNLDTLITLHQRKCDTLQKLKKSMLQKMFPKNDSLYPEIRFEGFTDAWEQRELKELASFAKGSGYSKNDIKEQGTPLILYGRLYTKYETKIYEVDTFAEPQKGSIYSKGCEVIVPASGETSEDIARASYVAKSGILLGGDLNIIYPNDTIEPTFLALSISNGEQQKNLAKKAQGKSVVHLHNSDLETVNIVYPTRTEQARIGQYFDHLDTLITLHQRKLETLKKLKKSMLQKMFI